MSGILRLQYNEPVQLDRSQLEVLYRRDGPDGADRLVVHAADELAVTLARATAEYRAGDIVALRGSVRAMIALAHQVGMTTLARVARDVLSVSATLDAAAFAATMARLERIGEGSLMAVWDLQDLSI